MNLKNLKIIKKMKSKSSEIEKARRELILLYLGIKLRKESEVITINNIKNNLYNLGFIINRRRIYERNR
jgi:hypothetical protein